MHVVHVVVVEAGVVAGRLPAASPARRRRRAGPPACSSRAATSIRNPSTPRSSQNRIVFSTSAQTSRLVQFRSGWSAVKMCRYHSPPPGPRTRVQAGPPKTLVQLFGGCSAVGAAPGPEVEAGPFRAARRGVQRGPEPLVLAGDVVRDQVDGHLAGRARARRRPARRTRPGHRRSGRRCAGRPRRSRGRSSARCRTATATARPPRAAPGSPGVPGCPPDRRSRPRRNRRTTGRRSGRSRRPATTARWDLAKASPERYPVLPRTGASATSKW